MITTKTLDTVQHKYNTNASDYAYYYNNNIHRKRAVQKAYDIHKKKVPYLYGYDVNEHIRRELGVKEGETFVKITPNNYPYHLPMNFKHDLIWCSDNLSDIFVIESVAMAYTRHNYNYQHYLWQAPESSRSVKGIAHFHLIYTV